ncbi:MAG: sulfatase-like hydrolase/transferase, partial [Bacteroidota bacterium]
MCTRSSRSTLISGVYAPSLATDWHREQRAVPDSFYFPLYLQELGYYCSNNSKKDYNARGIPNEVWDAGGKNAHWKNTPAGQPFFSVFNTGITHMKRVATRDTSGRWPRQVSPASVRPAATLPNLPELRDDLAWHLDAVAEMDQWVGRHLQALKDAGKSDSTIIFFFSDHGGCTPGSKAYVSERGGRVPMLVYFPPAFEYLAPMAQPGVIDSFMQFVDLGPTMIHLAGGKVPPYMTGRPVMGPQRQPFRDRVLLYRANQGDNFIPSRSLIQGDYHLVWNFNTAYPQGARQLYQWQMPGFMAWEQACLAGTCDSVQAAFWRPMPTWELYDLTQDPEEVHNLAYLPGRKHLRDSLAECLLTELKAESDLGFFPRSLRRQKEAEPFYQFVRRTQLPVGEVIDAAAFASKAEPSDVPQLL